MLNAVKGSMSCAMGANSIVCEEDSFQLWIQFHCAIEVRVLPVMETGCVIQIQGIRMQQNFPGHHWTAL